MAALNQLNKVAQSLRKPSLTLRTKHKKLDDNWEDSNDTIKDGVRFLVKYIGMTMVEESKGEDMSSTAVRRIINMFKAHATKPEKVQLLITPQGIKVSNTTGSNVINDISVVRISYCSADKIDNKIFSFVARNDDTDTMECRAYMCSSKKEAQSLTITVANAFKVAHELYGEDGADIADANDITNVRTDFNLTNGQLKNENKIGTFISQIAEIRRYQRLSSGSQPEINDIMAQGLNNENKDARKPSSEDDNPFNSDDDTNDCAFIEENIKPNPEIKNVEIAKPATLKLAKPTPIVSLLPPPKSDRNSPLRLKPSNSIIDINGPAPISKPKVTNAEEVENWDSHFAELAISRHRNSEDQLNENSPSYHESNPFATSVSNNSNPFA